MEGIVVDQEGAQQRLLGLQIVRRRPVPLALLGAPTVAQAPPPTRHFTADVLIGGGRSGNDQGTNSANNWASAQI